MNPTELKPRSIGVGPSISLELAWWLLTAFFVTSCVVVLDLGWYVVLLTWSCPAIILSLATMWVLRRSAAEIRRREIVLLVLAWGVMLSLAEVLQFDPAHWLRWLAEAPYASFRSTVLSVIERSFPWIELFFVLRVAVFMTSRLRRARRS